MALENSVVGNLDAGASDWIRAICVADHYSCNRITTANCQFPVEVVGRYRSEALDPDPRQQGNKVRLIEISKINIMLPGLENVNWLREDLDRRETGYGCGGGGPE